MLVDRSRFLKLAVALAATTSVATAACSAEPEEADSEDGNAALSAGGACNAQSIRRPGEGSQSFFAYEEGFCSDLAAHLDSPDAEGISVRWFDFIYDQCKAYSQQLQPAVAKKVQQCLANANTRRAREPRLSCEDFRMATEEFNATTMYECGKTAIYSVCSDGIDGRVQQRAERIANIMKAKGDRRGIGTIVREAAAVLSAFKTSGREQLETCMKSEWGGDLYSCVEGITIDYARYAGEAEPVAAQACLNAGGAAPPANACDAVMAKIERESAAGAFAVPEFAKAHCESYLKNFQPAAAREAIACLTNPAKKTYQNIYKCGADALKKTCQNPAQIDATVNEIVASISRVDQDANKGGRVTRQARTLLTGLKPAARDAVKRCVPALASQFAEVKMGGNLALYSCVEGLD